LADRSSSASCAAASPASSLRRAVPLIGLEVTVPAARRRKSSGESDATAARVTPGPSPASGTTRAAAVAGTAETPMKDA
jgi:hypothetical protein